MQCFTTQQGESYAETVIVKFLDACVKHPHCSIMTDDKCVLSTAKTLCQELALVFKHSCSCIVICTSNSSQHLSRSDAQRHVGIVSCELLCHNLQLQSYTRCCMSVFTCQSKFAFRCLVTAWFHRCNSTISVAASSSAIAISAAQAFLCDRRSVRK